MNDFPLRLRMIFSENRVPLFGIMLKGCFAAVSPTSYQTVKEAIRATVIQANYLCVRPLPGRGRDAKERPMEPFTVYDLEKRVQTRPRPIPGRPTRVRWSTRVSPIAPRSWARKPWKWPLPPSPKIAPGWSPTADLLYHLFVVLEVRGVSLAEVEAVLGERTRQTGLDEKAARKGG